MGLMLDHVVHAVQSPSSAMEIIRKYGIHTTAGGKHSNGGTYNSLAYFGLSYIEFLGVYDVDLASVKSDNVLPQQVLKELHTGGGLMRIALRTSSIEEVVKRLQTAGAPVLGPIRLGRTRPDGRELSWTLLFPEVESGKLQLPFLIEWDETDEARERELRESGAIAPHGQGDLHIAEIGFAVQNLDETVATWSAFLGQAPARLTTNNGDINADVAVYSLPNVELCIYTPKGAGRIEDVLRERGEKPFYVGISGSNVTRRDLSFDGGWYRFL